MQSAAMRAPDFSTQVTRAGRSFGQGCSGIKGFSSTRRRSAAIAGSAKLAAEKAAVPAWPSSEAAATIWGRENLAARLFAGAGLSRVSPRQWVSTRIVAISSPGLTPSAPCANSPTASTAEWAYWQQACSL